MDIRFIHDISKNYMVIRGENLEKENYKIKMLQGNDIEGLLKVKEKSLDSETRLYYDISSKQSMQVIYESSYIKLKDLTQIIIELEVCIESLKKYLLDFNDIILDPKMIFMDINTLKYSFCYMPNHNGDFRNQLREYLNFVITKIDHSDFKALNIAYELQKVTRIENFVLKDLTDLLEEPEIIKKEETVSEIIPNEVISYDIPYVNKKINITQKVLEKSTIVIFIIGILIWLYIFSKTSNENVKKIILIVIPAISIYMGYVFYLSKKPVKKVISKVDEIEEFVIQDNVEDQEDCLTVYLGDSIDSANKYLKSLGDISKDIKIETFPVIIGKMETKSDVVIKDSMISRIHAKIYNENQEYFIEDLNSTNGTFVNGERLAPYEKSILKPGDMVKFSENAYKFV